MNKHDDLFIRIAREVSKQSYALKLKVGCICVKDGQIISMGYNGTPVGWDNTCEDIIDIRNVCYETRPEVLHAEENCISKLAKSTISSKDSTIYITHAPCIQCSKLIYSAGIHKVIYEQTYKSEAGIEFLKKCGVEVNKHGDNSTTTGI